MPDQLRLSHDRHHGPGASVGATIARAMASTIIRWLSPTFTVAGLLVSGRAVAQSAPQDGPFFLHASGGFNVYTYAGAAEKTPSQSLTPADHPMTFEQVGAGYWVHPNIRLQLTGMLGETLSGLKPGASALTQVSIIPWVVFTSGGFFVGTGPLFAPRAFGVDAFNVGIFTCGGYGLRLGQGWSLALALQVPVMIEQRASVAITPAIVLGWRFGS